MSDVFEEIEKGIGERVDPWSWDAYLARVTAPRLVAALRKAEAALEGIVYISDAGLIDTTHKDERGNLARDIEQAREALAAIKAAREGRSDA